VADRPPARRRAARRRRPDLIPAGTLSQWRALHVAVRLADGRVLVAGGGTGDLCSPATGIWTATGPLVYPYASAAAALLPNGQVLYAGGRRVKYCGQYYCDEPLADAELYTP